jgi:hypothetical protein
MFRNSVFSLLTLTLLCVGATSAVGQFQPAISAPGTNYLEWTQDSTNSNLIQAWMTPDVYNRLVTTGVLATEGTVSSRPFILSGAPGAGSLVLGTHRYNRLWDNGWAQRDGLQLIVVTLSKQGKGITLFGIEGPGSK